MSAPELIPFRFPGIDGVGCAFTTRRCPDPLNGAISGNLAQNDLEPAEQTQSKREHLGRRLGFQDWLDVRQVHGTDMVFDQDASMGASSAVRPKADALATDKPGRALAIKVADCQPVLLTHRSGHYIAALHVGWRANRSGAPLLWTQAFCRHYSLEPADILAVRGPSLGPGRSEFINFETEWGPDFTAYFDAPSRCLDLWRLTRDQLLQAGISRENIFGLDLCTYSLPELFYSYRRNHDQGRQAGLIWIEPS